MILYEVINLVPFVIRFYQLHVLLAVYMLSYSNENVLQDKFASMIAEAGFQKVEYENLVGGVVAIHSGVKV